ncbi:MAG: NAD(P)/FAD-dependent oxidoreductase [Actinomycetota bacterium]|nr:NAD(P)/FAD-dependent oxidoreductase [Actinomycetota bacterium]
MATRSSSPSTAPYDVIVVGGGPAGLSAATWAARYRRSVLVVDSGEYRNKWVETSHGYLGSDPANPMTLLEQARADLARYPEVTFCEGRATAARRHDDGPFVVTVDEAEYSGLRLVLATGVVDDFPEVDGFFDHYGRSIFHCTTCDGYEAQGRSVVILGWGEQVVSFAVGLLNWADNLTVVTEGRSLEGDERHRRLLARHSIRLIEDDAVALLGEPGALRGVRLAGGDVLETELVFFSIAHRPRLDLARQLGCEVDDDSCLYVDRDGLTSIPGCYAAGDITPGFQLAPVAVGKGAAAGVAAAISLQGEEGSPSSPYPAPNPTAELEEGD